MTTATTSPPSMAAEVLRGSKAIEIFSPEATGGLGAYPIHDPLRAHHSKVPHCCLAARLESSHCSAASERCWDLRKVRSYQVQLNAGDFQACFQKTLCALMHGHKL